MDDNLELRENFIGFYEIPNINADTIFSVIEDCLIRMDLSLQNCRGKCYDGAGSMIGIRTGLLTQIQNKVTAAHKTHAIVKDTTKKSRLLTDTMLTTKEICTLVKFSPKREQFLENIGKDMDI